LAVDIQSITMDLVHIDTRRLLLTGISPGDMTNIFERLPKPEVKKILGHRSEEAYLKEAFKQKSGYSSHNRSFLLFLLTDKASETIIGRCGLHKWNVEHKRAEIGYVMADARFKGKGLMTEAIKAIIDYGFTKMKLNRTEALVGIGNVPSLRIMEKFKFKKEGILRQYFHISTQFEDSVLFSKLYCEYIDEKSNR